jgi:methylated-DNA-[protein]-cysteine S-methyltransferase
MAMTLRVQKISTPTGPMSLVLDEADRLCFLEWDDHEDRMRRFLTTRYAGEAVNLTGAPGPTAATRALDAYFGGDIAALDALPTAARGTDFQRAVWAGLRTIPPGTTLSYAGLAERIGRPSAVRAVGLANGANPIAIVVPCHRVIGADGTLTGYGGGLDRKRWLLAHESRVGATRFELR